MIPKEVIKKIKKIEIKSNKIVNEILSGEYHSIFKGNGMEFDDIIEYQPGDDIRNIDWNVTARQNKPFIKKFKEERERNLFLLVDVSSSNLLGKKKEIITEVSGMLAFSAIKNNDKVGTILFTDKVEKYIPLEKGKKHVLSILENILIFKPENKKTNINNILKIFNEVVRKRSIVFVISDFLDTDYEKKVKVLSKKHDIILVRIIDPLEKKLPKGAIFSFEDLETNEEIVVENIKHDTKLSYDFPLPSKNIINIFTDKGYIRPLILFFKKRMRIIR